MEDRDFRKNSIKYMFMKSIPHLTKSDDTSSHFSDRTNCLKSPKDISFKPMNMN